MSKIRVVVIEDNRLLRECIIATIDGQADMKVVASSGGNENIVRKATSVRAQVILVDLGLRNLNDLNIARTVSRDFPELKVIGMGLVPTQSDIVGFVEAGASGFILKDASVRGFLGTIRTVARGGKVLPPALTGSLFFHAIDQAFKRGRIRPASAVRMTKRERGIVALIADGLSNKEIAQKLNIATYTVKSHVHNVLEKLALRSRLQPSSATRGTLR